MQREIRRGRDEVGLTNQWKVGRDGDKGECFLSPCGKRDTAAWIVGGSIIGDAPLLFELIKDCQVALAQRGNVGVQTYITAISIDDIAKQGLVDAQAHKLQSNDGHDANRDTEDGKYRSLSPTHQRARSIGPVESKFHRSIASF